MKSPQSDNKDIFPPTKPCKRWYSYLGNAIIITLAIGVALIFVYGYWIPKTYKIPSISMEPTILRGDYIIALKYFSGQKPKRGDLVVFSVPNYRTKEFIKRVVGLPGEKLEIRQQQVFINDQPLDEPYAQHTEPPGPASPANRDDFRSLVIPNGQVFVLGDNRENSFDSRIFGFLPIKDISRKTKWIYWSWDDLEGAIRWERIGKSVE